ncbi:alpha-(1,3)-fucosyltransferase C-like [Patella vulgata]|uniref:alpha-(1,3)-fucosyltransferase C-like n=1 Tax=Patella vulgata TaxID=6465 RepID=UPI0024A923AE|nr:alpha-(1,3)-fucosyltransferase C-like [Patella vulgata]
MTENRKRKLVIILIMVLTVILYLTNLKATNDEFVKFLKGETPLNSSKDDTKPTNEVFVNFLKEAMPLNSSKDDTHSIHANNVKSKHSNNPKSEHYRNPKSEYPSNLKTEHLQPEHPSNPYILTNVSSHLNTRSSNKSRSNKKRRITIHWYNRPSGLSSQTLRNWFSQCNDSCIYTEDINSDILIFDGDSLAGNPPVRRNPNQVWVFREMESPVITSSHQWLKPSWRNKFNRTFTYRVDSDQFTPYGFYRKRKEPLKKNITAIMKQKFKLVSIFSSNCGVPSQREKYINLLRKYIPVDFYGRCGNLTCPKSHDCFISNAKTYKFYLSFENSLCRDYVSEKFFRPESLDIVAVTRGGANYSKIAPAKTYIDTSDFKSVKDLANFLLYLDRNDTAYRQYLENKQSYESIYMCILCFGH